VAPLARRRQRLVAGEGHPAGGLAPVAAGAGEAGVRALERERRIAAVVECEVRPGLWGGVTAGAGGRRERGEGGGARRRSLGRTGRHRGRPAGRAPAPGELTQVRVAVAAGAGGREAREAEAVGPPRLAAGRRRGAVAGAAGGPGMSALEGEAGYGVVEGDGAPAIHPVARLAAARGDPAVDLAAVRVGVAGGAAGGSEAEAGGEILVGPPGPGAAGGERPHHGGRAAGGAGRRQLRPRHLQVAGVARHREVGAGKRELGLLVLLETEGRGQEARHAVAIGTAARVRRELPGVRVGVAGRAALERRLRERVQAPAADRHRDRAARVAAVAGAAAEPGVLAAQREAGAVVVDGGAVDAAPAGGRVTRRAGLAQPAAVGIGVAARAGVELEAAEPARSPAGLGIPPARVALPAGDLAMAAGEREAGAAVVEAADDVPPLERVARGAGAAGELPAVGIGVAVGT